MRIILLLIFALNISAASIFAEDNEGGSRISQLNKLKIEYSEFFEKFPIFAEIAAQDFIDGISTFEETRHRLASMDAQKYQGSCSLLRSNE